MSHMRLGLLGAVLLIGSGLAGCIGDQGDLGEAADADPATGAAATPAIPQLLSSTGCADQIGFFFLPMEDARAFLPEGFEPEPHFLDPTGQTAMFYVLGASCADSAVDGASVGAALDISAGLLVTPPAEYQSDTVDFYAVLFGIFQSNEKIVEVLNAWGVESATVGDVTFSLQPVGSVNDVTAARVGTAAGSDADFAVDLRTVTVGPATMGEEGAIRLFSVAGEDDEEEDEDEAGEEEDADEGPEISAVDLHWTAANYAEGVAIYTETGSPLPVVPLFGEAAPGAQTWGDDYQVHIMPVWLPEVGDDEEDEDALPLSVTGPRPSLFGVRFG